MNFPEGWLERDVERAYHQAREHAADVLTNALCIRYQQLTGKQAPDKLRDEVWQVVYFVA